MNLSLSKKADYVIKAGIALARVYDGDTYVKVRQIAAEMAIPRSYTPQILDALIRNGLVESRAGKTGGYRLIKDPVTITVLELLEAGEGPLNPANCALSNGPCRWDTVCPMHEVMSTAVNRFRETMQAELLSELASRDLLLERGELRLPENPHVRNDPARDFSVSASALVEAPRLEVLSRLQLRDGEWLSAPMLSAAKKVIAKEGLGYLFTAKALENPALEVNLGYVHEQGTFINIPVTIEGSKAKQEVPRFVGNISLSSTDESKTLCEINGRFEFNLGNISGSQAMASQGLHTLQIQLDLLAARICEDFLAELCSQIESRV